MNISLVIKNFKYVLVMLIGLEFVMFDVSMCNVMGNVCVKRIYKNNKVFFLVLEILCY